MQTPLYEKHIAIKARMVDFSGWQMPLLYKGIIPEHHHTRAQVSLFDICHMGEFELSGPTAEADLELLLTQPVAAIKPHAGSYGYLLNEQGGVIDDLICFRLGPERFWLVVNAGTTAGDAEWIRQHLSARTVFRDLSASTGKIDIQGPAARTVLENLFPGQVPDLKYFRCAPTVWHDTAVLLSRTGYTGEWGYELYLPLEATSFFWDMLLQHPSCAPAGLGARDTLRVEMGYPLYGHELSAQATPAGVAGGRFMNLEKNFIGRDAVRRALDSEQTAALVGLQIQGRMSPRAGDQVFNGPAAAGTVTSGLFAPSLGHAVALAYVDRAVSDIGCELEARVRNKPLPARVVALPFYNRGTARGPAAPAAG